MADKIPFEQVESSNIDGLGYDPERQILAVKFKSGTIFHHAPFTPEQALELYGAPSKGSYYAKNIKGGKVPGEKMTGTCPKCGGAPGWIGDTCTDCGTDVYAETPRAGGQHGA